MRVSLKTLLCRFAVAAALIPATIGYAAAAAPANLPTCTGKDMLAEIRVSDPASYEAITAAAAATENAGALLWRVEREGLKPSYLMGTIHLTDERITTLSPAAKLALKDTSRILLEVADMSAASLGKAMAEVAPLLLFTDGRQLDQMLTPAQFAMVQKVLARSGMPPQLAPRLKPWLIYMLMSLSTCERQRGAAGVPALDLKLSQEAKAMGHEVIGLETAAEQLRAMAGIPVGDQVKLLTASIKYADRTADMQETMVRFYTKRQIAAAWPFQLALAKTAGVDAAAFESFRRKILVERNFNMRDRALADLAKGATFMAVGALHLPGSDGLVALLEQSGYRLTPIE